MHTVAAAAYGLLKDIKKARGRGKAAVAYLTGLLYTVRDYHRGALPLHMTSDAEERVPWLRATSRRALGQFLTYSRPIWERGSRQHL